MTTRGGVLGSALLLAAAASFLPGVLVARVDPWAWPSLAVQGVSALAGALLLLVPEYRRDGWWLLGATIAGGFVYFSFPTFATGYWAQIGWSFQYAMAPFIVGPLLRLPDQPAPPRTVRRVAVGILVVLVGLRAASGLFWDPAMAGDPGPGRWFTLFPSEPVVWGVQRAVPVLWVPVAVDFTLAQVRRYRHAAGPHRRAVRLLGWLSVPLVVGMVGRLALEAYGASQIVLDVAGLIHVGLSAATFVAVLVLAVGANLRRAGFLDALLAAGGDPAGIEAVLAMYVGDSTLRLRFHTDEGWTDTAGRPVVETVPGAKRAFRPIVVEPDGPAVMADIDAGLDTDSRLVAPLLEAAGVVLGRARLSVQQAAQTIELRASRARIVEAGVQQRRQMERDLHDGAQQHLLAAQAALARAELGGEPEAVSEAISFAQSRLTTTMAELRGLARGQHPALLSQAGLASALASLVQLSDRVGVQVSPELRGRRLAAVVEATAWFVASEGVVNALKYSNGPVTVMAGITDSLEVRIADAGPGGAKFVPGGGLTGLRDRVHGAGGTLQLDSVVGGPTILRVTLPTGPPEERA